jgi:Lrp/AsnC family transcriptional regulator for asnA, asnC and gidA
MQRMQEVGIITGSSYEINPKALGYNISTYIGIKLEKGSLYKQVVPQLKEIPEIVECHFTLGPYTILIKLYAKNDEHLMELLNKKIQEIDGVTSTETLMSLEQSIKRDLEIK